MQIHDAMRCLSLKPRTSFELMTFLLRTTKDQISYKNGAVIISDELWLLCFAPMMVVWRTYSQLAGCCAAVHIIVV